MPKPKKGESRKDYMGRCVKQVMGEGLDQNAAVGKCEGMYDEHIKQHSYSSVSSLVPVGGLIGANDSADKTVEIMLCPWGKVKSTKGNFTVDQESADEMMSAFTAGGKDIPIDYEHTTVGGPYSTPSGAAPAAGWITAIHCKPGVGIFAQVKWNDQARAMILSDEYRYLSPVLAIRKDDRKAVAISSAALTNVPAIVDMRRVAASDKGETGMDLTALKKALSAAGISLADDSDEDDVVNAAKSFIENATKDKSCMSALAAKLGVEKDSTIEVLTARIDAIRADTVPATEYKAVTARLETLENDKKARESHELVASAIERAKLNPNDDKQIKWAREYSKTDPVGFKSWADAAPELHGVGRYVKQDDDANAKHSGGREAIIASARDEYDANRHRMFNVNRSAFVNQELRTKNMAVLTAKEKEAIDG